jgi:hypothetical protein
VDKIQKRLHHTANVETLFLPFLFYYWAMALLLPVANWVIVVGVILGLALRFRWPLITTQISLVPSTVRRVGLTVAGLGIIGTMPTSYFYGAIGAEIAGSLGRAVDRAFSLPWPVFSTVFALFGSIIAVLALMLWAFIIWWFLGAIIGLVLHSIIKFVSLVFRRTEPGTTER